MRLIYLIPFSLLGCAFWNGLDAAFPRMENEEHAFSYIAHFIRRLAPQSYANIPNPNEDFAEYGVPSLQDQFSGLFSAAKQPYTPVPASVGPVLQAQINQINELCGADEPFRDMHFPHMQAYFKLLTIFQQAADRSPEDFMGMARVLRDNQRLNYKLWYRAVISVSTERAATRGLVFPNQLQVVPDDYLSAGLLDLAASQACKPIPERECVLMNGSLTAEANRLEHDLWYFREDYLLNAMHELWHTIYTKNRDSSFTPHRRGELFYYFHRNILARYQTEKLGHGLEMIQPLDILQDLGVPIGYYPFLKELNSKVDWGDRKNNKTLQDVGKWVEVAKRIVQDIQDDVLYYPNGTELSLKGNLRGINYLGDLVEASRFNLNTDRYDLICVNDKGEQGPCSGLHNNIHDALAELSTNKRGIMGATATAMRDPIFYRWHLFVDQLFRMHKDKFEPYQPNQGFMQLEWPKVTITDLRTESGDMDDASLLRTNSLQTAMEYMNVSVPFSSDVTPCQGGNIDYCIKTLNHAPFTYKLRIVNNDGEPKWASLRLFMAPKYDRTGRAFTLEEQRTLFFAMDHIALQLKPGSNQYTFSSTQSTESLTRPWDYYNQTDNNGMPRCGCGWPHHLLLPRGTPEGMTFDLFAMVTKAEEDWPAVPFAEPIYCSAAHILCGNFDKVFPDTRPMGYPFDRRAYVGPQGTLSQFVSPIPNMIATQVKIYHMD